MLILFQLLGPEAAGELDCLGPREASTFLFKIRSCIVRAACLQNETAPEKNLNRYEKRFEKREKGSEKRSETRLKKF